VVDGKGNELHSSPISSESSQEGEVFVGLLLELIVASEVPTEADLDDDEVAYFLVDVGQVGEEVSSTLRA